MYQIQMVLTEPDALKTFYDLSETYDELDVIEEKSFNGDLSTVSLYISLTVNIITVLTPIITALIKKKKVSSLKMEGDKIELENVSEDLIKQLFEIHYNKNNLDKKQDE